MKNQYLEPRSWPVVYIKTLWRDFRWRVFQLASFPWTSLSLASLPIPVRPALPLPPPPSRLHAVPAVTRLPTDDRVASTSAAAHRPSYAPAAEDDARFGLAGGPVHARARRRVDGGGSADWNGIVRCGRRVVATCCVDQQALRRDTRRWVSTG